MNSLTDEQKLNEKYVMMTQTPVHRLILKMSVPTIISMLVTSIYNLADSFFVGHLSTLVSDVLSFLRLLAEESAEFVVLKFFDGLL